MANCKSSIQNALHHSRNSHPSTNTDRAQQLYQSARQRAVHHATSERVQCVYHSPTNSSIKPRPPSPWFHTSRSTKTGEKTRLVSPQSRSKKIPSVTSLTNTSPGLLQAGRCRSLDRSSDHLATADQDRSIHQNMANDLRPPPGLRWPRRKHLRANQDLQQRRQRLRRHHWHYSTSFAVNPRPRVPHNPPRSLLSDTESWPTT